MKNSWSSMIILVVFLCLVVETQADQKKGFRGGEKSYGITVEANPVGTNLNYKLPEAKAKSSSPMDWKVDNDNAQMVVAVNSPVAAFVYTKNSKFNVQGAWPGYKTHLELPKDVKTAKKNEMEKVRNDEASGIGIDLSPVGNPSGNGALGSEVSEGSSSSGNSEIVRQSGEDFVGFERSVSGAGEDDLQQSESEEVGEYKTLKRRSKVSHSIKTKPRRSKTKAKTKKKTKQNKDDLFLRKVKHAVKKLKHFDLDDPKTSKALKDIITHAKRVVLEAKTVLRDVASVVRSVQNFVTGKFDSKDQELLNMTLLDDGENARENAEYSALQANVSAEKAQAASKMAEEIANNFWKVAQKSRALAKLGDVVSPHKNPAMDTFVKIHDKSHQRDILLKGKSSDKNSTENSNQFKNQTTELKEQEKTSRLMATRIIEGKLLKNVTNDGNLTIVSNNKSTKAMPEVIDYKEIKLDNLNATDIHAKRKEDKKDMKAGDNKEREQPAVIQKQAQLSRNHTKQKESRKKHDKNATNVKAKETQDTNEEANLISKAADLEKKDTDLKKQMASLIQFRVTKLPKLKGRKTQKDKVNILTSLIGKKVGNSENDENKKKKNAADLQQNKVLKSKQTLKDKERKIKKKNKDSVKTDSKKLYHKHDDTTDDDVNDPNQSGSAMSGTYDVELEVEPEKLEFSKGGGKMKEKKIKIKNMTADGKMRKISPVTFGKILKAIRRVEGILGFTIEKEKENQKKRYKIQKLNKM